MNLQKPKKQLRKYAIFSGMAFQMVATILIGVYLGKWLDKKYPNDDDIFTAIFSLLFVLISLYIVIKQALKISKDD